MIKFILKYKIFIIASLIVVVGSIIVIAVMNSGPNTVVDNKEYIDSDTGETIDDSSRSPENGGETSHLTTVIGLEPLTKTADVSLTLEQMLAFRDDLATSGIKTLDGYDSIVKIIKPYYSESQNIIITDLKYNESKAPAKVHISIDTNGGISYLIIRDGVIVYNSGNLYEKMD